MMKKENDKDLFPLFTVIIPAKNRGSYLYHTLRTCMIQDYPNLEIIVSDDGSTDNTKEIVENAIKIDSRIRYFSHLGGIGMKENFEFALKQIKPGYVIALGADDGLLPGGITGMYKVLRDKGMDLLTWPAAMYTFPDVAGNHGQLQINFQKGIRIIDSKEYLQRQSRKFNYILDVETPMFYVKGVASTKLIDRVCSRTTDGGFYSCSTPDGYSGIVLAGEVSQYAFSGQPFSIYGLSSSSQGLAYLSNDEKARKDSESFFQYSTYKPMHKDLASQPYSPLITLMTVDFLLTAKDLPGWEGSFPQINYKKVICSALKELKHGLYGDKRISRELLILRNIAIFHGIEKFFNAKVKLSRRYRQKERYTGSGVTPNLLLIDGDVINDNNIFDASYFAKNIYKIYSRVSLGKTISIFLRSLNYWIRSKRKGKRFPKPSEWIG